MHLALLGPERLPQVDWAVKIRWSLCACIPKDC